MNREARIADKIVRRMFAGTWALPNTSVKAEKVIGGVRNMRRGKLPNGGVPDKKTMAEDVADYFDNLLGDDELFDDIGDLAKRFKEPEEFLRACAISIKSRVEKFVKEDRKSFRNPRDYENLVALSGRL